MGSCGTPEVDSGVDWMQEMALEVAREEYLSFKIGLVYAEQNLELIA